MFLRYLCYHQCFAIVSVACGRFGSQPTHLTLSRSNCLNNYHSHLSNNNLIPISYETFFTCIFRGAGMLVAGAYPFH